MKVLDKKSYKHRFLLSYRLTGKICLRIQNTLQTGIPQEFFPEIPMASGKGDEIVNSTGFCVTQEGNRGKRKTCDYSNRLQQIEPVITNPMMDFHHPIIPRLAA